MTSWALAALFYFLGLVLAIGAVSETNESSWLGTVFICLFWPWLVLVGCVAAIGCWIDQLLRG